MPDANAPTASEPAPIWQPDPDEAALADAERRGLNLALVGRNLALIPLALYIGLAGTYPGNVLGVALVGLFFGLGLFWRWLLLSSYERRWHRYALFTLDIVALAAAALFVPVSVGGDVPQIFVFRGFGAIFIFIFLGVAALSLMPGLLLWIGCASSAAIWLVFGIIVAGMETTTSWSDLPPGPAAKELYAVFFRPDFIGVGNRVSETIVILTVASLLALAVHRARNVVRQQARTERERLRTLEVFGQYVPREVATEILATPEALRPQTREATVLFCDVEGFTRFAETRTPAAVITTLNKLFSMVSDKVTNEGGVVVSFVGDGVLAAFNAPRPCPDHPARALRAAQAILDRLAVETIDGERINVRIGIATGLVAAGSVGASDRQTYTVYGDTVNVAQRLEAMNKELGTGLLLDRQVWIEAGEPDGFIERPPVALRNRDQPLAVVSRS